jgi:hypothetical protein
MKEANMATENKPHLIQPNEQAPNNAQAAPDNAPAATPNPNPFAPENLRINLNIAEGAGVKKMIVTIPVRKPHDQEFFRVRPEPGFHLPAAVIKLKDERETFLVTPETARAIPGEFVYSTVYTLINRQGNLLLWPIPLPDAKGRQLEWHRSATEAVERAMTKWLRIKANTNIGAYDIFEATANIPDPEWPDLTFERMLEIAFRDRLVNNINHRVLQQLRGEV